LGTISYDLNEIDHRNKVLVRGAMGHAIAVGLGYALGSDKKVIVVIGEGSLLMKMGSMATVLAHAPKDFEVHIMFNGEFKSCGGQKNYFGKIQSWASRYPHFYIHDVR